MSNRNLSKEKISEIHRLVALKGNFGKWMKGKKASEETKRKMSETAKKSRTGHWNKGKIRTQAFKEHLREYNKTHGVGKWMKGRTSPFTKKWKENPAWLKGKNNPNWKGGITPLYEKIRKSKEYKLWRKAVFERDNWTCVWCDAKSGNGKAITLNADHIKPFALFPELRFAIDNGRTLCIECHRKTDSWGRPKKLEDKLNQ